MEIQEQLNIKCDDCGTDITIYQYKGLGGWYGGSHDCKPTEAYKMLSQEQIAEENEILRGVIYSITNSYKYDSTKRRGNPHDKNVIDNKELGHKVLSNTTNKAMLSLGWTYIQYDTTSFIEELRRAKQTLEKNSNKQEWEREAFKFIDAGCGIGMNSLIANNMGFSSYGLELEKETLEVARKINNYNAKERFLNQDILKYKHYSDFDVIYYYWPIANKEVQRKFERYVEDQMKVGAVLIANMKQDMTILKDKRFESVSGNHIYLKVKE